MKNLTNSIVLLYFLAFSSTVTAQQPTFAGPIDSCLDVFDGKVDGYTEYFIGQDNQRYYKVTFTHPGCGDEYQTVFFDDFNDSSLDTFAWTTQSDCPPPGDSISCYCTDELDKLWLPSNVWVSGGFLHLKTSIIDPPLNYGPCTKDGVVVQQTRKFASAKIVSKNSYFTNSFEGGCFNGEGKFTIRAKIPNNVSNTLGAIWFFGWADEVDLIEVCKPDCDEMQTNRHLWVENPNHNCDGVKDNMSWAEDHDIGNINTFHNYTMEWTPYKIKISVDGESVRTFWRFLGHTDCENFTAGTIDTLWQNMLWTKLHSRMDLILNVGIRHLGEQTAGGEMVVDYIKIEQKIPAVTISRQNPGSAPDVLCVGEIAQFKASVAGSPTYPVSEWTTSNNLAIQSISQNTQTVTVKAIGPNGPAWVQARLWNQKSCFGTNIRKPLGVGIPFPLPQISAQRECSKITLTASNYSSAFTYQWQILTPGFTGDPTDNGGQFVIQTPPTNLPEDIDYQLTITSPCGASVTINGTTITKPCKKWELHVYPNPSNTYANFELINFSPEDLGQNLEIKLVDANFNLKKTMPVSQILETMDVSSVSPGYHYAYIEVDGETVITSQFLIQH